MEPTAGQALHDADAETRRQAAAAMGSARTPRKSETARKNVQAAIEARKGKPLTEEHKARIAQSRRDQIAARKQAAGTPEPPAVEKRKPGRPRKIVTEASAADAPKRPVGRPKKQDAQTPAPMATEAHTGTQEA